MNTKKRVQLLVDPATQLPLLSKAVFYWITCLVLMTMLIGIQVGFENPASGFNENLGKLLSECGPAVLASLLILPLFMFDCIRFSNRFAGPMRRVKQHLTELAENGETETIKIREDDFWADLAELVNRVASRVRGNQTES